MIVAWGAHATRVLCLATRLAALNARSAGNKRIFGESPETAHESRALPRDISTPNDKPRI